MKKKILFVTQQLECGGVEKALVNLLNLIDRDSYDCEMLVIENSGKFRDFFPEWINILEYDCPQYIKMMANYYRKPQIEEGDNACTKLSKIGWSLIHYLNKFTTKIFKKNVSYRVMFEKYKKRNDFSNYDMLVDFHGYGVYTTYLVAYQKTTAKKVSWIHEETIYAAYKYISECYKHFDYIFGNCIDSCNNFVSTFPENKEKIGVYYNFLDIQEIERKAQEKDVSLELDSEFNIVSVGRVSEQKSFHRAVEVAQILKEKGYEFKWMIIGEGEQYQELKEETKERDLDKCLIFHGFEENPYPYIAGADLYVQTSRAEGFCTTISEAVILGKPIVSTRVGGIEEQLDGSSGGIVTGHTSKEIAQAIIKLIENKEELNRLEQHNVLKTMDYEKEIEKLYKVL